MVKLTGLRPGEAESFERIVNEVRLRTENDGVNMFWTYVVGAVVAVALLWFLVLRHPVSRILREREAKAAIRQFRIQREALEAKFFDLAGRRGKPRGLRWLECDWQPAVTFARAVDTHLLTAFVAVNIHFEAIEGGDMEDVDAVDTVRDAAAVFHYSAGRWGTGGRALFNMNPQDAIERLQGQYVPALQDQGNSLR